MERKYCVQLDDKALILSFFSLSHVHLYDEVGDFENDMYSIFNVQEILCRKYIFEVHTNLL